MKKWLILFLVSSGILIFGGYVCGKPDPNSYIDFESTTVVDPNICFFPIWPEPLDITISANDQGAEISRNGDDLYYTGPDTIEGLVKLIYCAVNLGEEIAGKVFINVDPNEVK